VADIVNLESHYIGSPEPGVNLYQVPNAAMQVLADIINATWNEGIATKEEFSAKITEALAGFLEVTSAPHVSTGAVPIPVINEEIGVVPDNSDLTPYWSVFTQATMDIINMLAQLGTDFMNTYFATESTAYIEAENWLRLSLQNPESGLPLAVQQRIFGDDEARIFSGINRASEAAVAQFAGRGFPLPPDTVAAMIGDIEMKGQEELAASSRKLAVLWVEMQKFSVEKVLELRKTAITASTDFIKALASAPNVTAQLMGIGYDAKSKMLSAMSSLLSARSGAAEVVTKAYEYNNSIALDASGKNQSSDLQMVENKLKALLAEATAIAQMTTALFNNINVGAHLQANGGTNVSQSGEI
jgi:hypothetical protein